MKMIISFLVGIIFTLMIAYFFFIPPDTPPNYVYVIIFLVFYTITYAVISWIKGRKSHHEPGTEKQPS